MCVKSRMTKNIPEIIERLGGPSELARQLGKPTTTVASWAIRRSIPVKFWPVMVVTASKRGIKLDYERLVNLHLAS